MIRVFSPLRWSWWQRRWCGEIPFRDPANSPIISVNPLFISLRLASPSTASLQMMMLKFWHNWQCSNSHQKIIPQYLLLQCVFTKGSYSCMTNIFHVYVWRIEFHICFKINVKSGWWHFLLPSSQIIPFPVAGAGGGREEEEEEEK